LFTFSLVSIEMTQHPAAPGFHVDVPTLLLISAGIALLMLLVRALGFLLAKSHPDDFTKKSVINDVSSPHPEGAIPLIGSNNNIKCQKYVE
jgi:hypothetical protein